MEAAKLNIFLALVAEPTNSSLARNCFPGWGEGINRKTKSTLTLLYERRELTEKNEIPDRGRE